MITDAQFATWLGSTAARRVMLFDINVVIGATPTTLRLSTKPYNDGNTPYNAVVVGGLKITESISMNSEASISAGDIEINNADGALDAWLDYVWANGTLIGYVGDATWAKTDFRQVFTGVAIDIGCKSRDKLNIKLANMLERLNTPVTDIKLGAPATNPDALVPVLLGECSNITPVQTNPNTLEYGFGDGSNQALLEVRTDGKPRSEITATITTGRFVFTGAIGGGTVTCSAQGTLYNGSYVNTIGQLVQYLVTQRGTVANRFTTADLDTAQLAAFESTHTQPVGLYLTSNTNILTACQQLASSVGAQLVPSMGGKLRLIQFAIPTSATINIPRSQQLDKSIAITDRTEVQAAVKIGYCRNYTPQPDLGTSLPAAHKDLYAKEWLSVTSVDATVQALYKRTAEPTQIDTCLLRGIDAQAEAIRRRDIIKVPRTTYSFETTPDQLLTELGQAVTLFSNRFGLSNGKVGLVTSRSVDWGTLRVTMGVTV